MNIDISKIIEDKIKDMEEKKIVETTIQETLQNSIVAAVKSALEGYTLRHMIEDKMEKEVSNVVSNIGFTGYNGFIAEKVKEIVQGTLNEDIVAKITKKFNEILVRKRDKIKLSEICDFYRKYICENTDESEQYDLQYFHVSINENEEYHWIDVEFAKEKDGYSGDKIKFTIHRRYDNRGFGKIGSLYIDGYGVDKTVSFGHMTDIELLLVNLKYNNTPIEIDVTDEDDIDTSFDIDI